MNSICNVLENVSLFQQWHDINADVMQLPSGEKKQNKTKPKTQQQKPHQPKKPFYTFLYIHIMYLIISSYSLKIQ